VKFYKCLISRLPCSQQMISRYLITSMVYYLSNLSYLFFIQAPIYKHLVSFIEDLETSNDNVNSYKDRNNRIKKCPSADFDKYKCYNNSNIGQKITLVMEKIRFYNQILCFLQHFGHESNQQSRKYYRK